MKIDVDIMKILSLSGRLNIWHFDLYNKNMELKAKDIKCIKSFTMTYNSLTTTKQMLSVQMHDDAQFNFLSDLLKVTLEIRVRGHNYFFPMGIFKLYPAESQKDGSITSLVRDTRTLTLYSLIKKYEEDAITTDLELAVGTNIRQEIIRQLGTVNYNFPTSSVTLQKPRVYEMGTHKIVIINELLDLLNWHSLCVDNDGIFYSGSNKEAALREIEIQYTDEENHMLYPSYNDTPETIDVYNMFPGYATVNDKLVSYMYINDREDSPTSTVNIGNKCADRREFQECTNLQDLQSKVKAWANDNSMKYHKCTFPTFINPLHGYLNCVLLKNKKVNMKGIETSWVIESNTDSMRHTIREAVVI